MEGFEVIKLRLDRDVVGDAGRIWGMDRTVVVDDVAPAGLYPICDFGLSLKNFFADVVWIYDVWGIIGVGVLDDGVGDALTFEGESWEGRIRIVEIRRRDC